MSTNKSHGQLVARNSEIVESLAKLANADDTPETRAEAEKLHNELAELQPELRAAAAAQEAEAAARLAGEPEPVAPELRTLVANSRVSDVIKAAMGETIDGATAELQAELGLGADQVPNQLLEVRTATPSPADVDVNGNPIIPAVWPQTAAAFLGVDMPTVPAGETIYTVLSTSLSAGAPNIGADQEDSTGAFETTTISPGRLQASFVIRREDVARLSQLEDSLRENLNMAMSDKRDSEIVTDLVAKLTAQSGDGAKVADFATYRGLVYHPKTLDGLFARSAMDVKLLVAPRTYSHAANSYRTPQTDEDALASLMRVSGGVRISTHVPTSTAKKDVVLVRKGMLRDVVSPTWQGVTMIVDPYSQSKAGEIRITAVSLRGRLEVLRDEGFAERVVQVAA